jgi:CoA-transferase family III
MFSRYPHILAFDVDTSFGKKNTYMDLRSDVDRSRVLELVRERDVFVQGFRWGSFARRGFGPEELAQINPRLIYVEVNAYGFQGIGGRVVVRLCDEDAVVLAAVQDAARRLRRCPAGILDRRCARRRGCAQVGTAGWPS